jgi:hypothetical protein
MLKFSHKFSQTYELGIRSMFFFEQGDGLISKKKVCFAAGRMKRRKL